MSRVWHRTGQAIAYLFECHIDSFAGAGASGFPLRGAIPGSRQDGVHIQHGCIPILRPSDGMDWHVNGEPSLMNSDIRIKTEPQGRAKWLPHDLKDLKKDGDPKGSMASLGRV